MLVVDNAEHLLDAVGELVDELLDAAPGLHLLVTSREPLGVDGEVHRLVEPLSEGDAVSLFVARAKATRPGFPDGPEHLAEVAALCGELDRLPLAVWSWPPPTSACSRPPS